MISNFVPTSIHFPKFFSAFLSFLLIVTMVLPAFAGSSQHSASVTVSIDLPSSKLPAQPFIAQDLSGEGWIGGATITASLFPPADVKSVVLSPVSTPSGFGSIATDRLWVKVGETTEDFVPLADVANRNLTNPNSVANSPLPEIEFRPTWQDPPGAYRARLQITPSAENGPRSTEPNFCDFEADVLPFLNFELENAVIQFVATGTQGEMQGSQNLQVRVTSNSENWKLLLSCTQDGKACPVRFELMNESQKREGPVSAYSSSTGAVTGKAAVNEHLLVFRPVCNSGDLTGGFIQVLVEGRTGN